MGYQREYFVGEDAFQLRGILKLVYPIERGLPEDYTALEKMMHHAFYTQLHATPIDAPVLVLVSPFWPRRARAKLLMILFETFLAESVTLVDFYALVLAVAGGHDGVVVDVQGGVTFVAAYRAGRFDPALSCRVDGGWRNVVDHARRLLKQRGYDFRTSVERALVEDMVVTHGRVAAAPVDPDAPRTPRAQSKPVSYTLPDGDVVPLGEERVLAPEVFFQPGLRGRQDPPIAERFRALWAGTGDGERWRARGIIRWGGQLVQLPGFMARVNATCLPSWMPPARSRPFAHRDVLEHFLHAGDLNLAGPATRIPRQVWEALGPAVLEWVPGPDLVHRAPVDKPVTGGQAR